MTERVGQQLGNYRLLRVLGQGAFAAVYLGEHQYLERPAAIKVLHVRMEEAHQESFRREARTIAKLQHPHIIGVHDFGIEDQTPYLVMEYTPNGTLRSRHPKGTQVPFERIVLYVKQIASALDYAHAQHVIHRDIKPENILLNTKQEVVLSDFGIAIVQQTLDSLSTQNPAGTPLYMAPEQIQRHPCPASDQYALGVMVYEWVCGESPFHGSLYEVFSHHLHQPPPSLRARLPELPAGVEDAVFGALAKDPGQRFASVADFAIVLEEAFFATQPLSLRAIGPQISRDAPTRPLARVTPVPASSLGQQDHPNASTRPQHQTMSCLKEEHERVQSGSPALAVHSQTVGKLAKLSVAQTNRQRLLRRVRSFWITGVLSHSLHGAVLLALGLQEQPDAVANPWHLIVQQPDTVPRPLPAGTPITQVYDDADGELLILGAPGSGKTTLLLELARDLLSRAEQDAEHPMPVVFNLSSWAMKQQHLTDWLVEELVSKYQVPRKLAQDLMDADQILPLLDGLDEVAPSARTACIKTINSYRREHGLQPLVVCSRSADYLEQTARVSLGRAVLVQPLAPEQVEAYLRGAGPSVQALHVAIHRDRDLQTLARTPLMLSILTLAYQGTPLHEIAPLGTLPGKQQQVFATYVQRMLAHRGANLRFTAHQTVQWLSYLARQMRDRNQTIFYLEHLQPDYLASVYQHSYRLLAVRLPALLVGILASLTIMALLVSYTTSVALVQFAVLGGLLGWLMSRPASRGGVQPRSGDARLRPLPLHRIARSILLSIVIGLIFGLSLGFQLSEYYGPSDWLRYGLIIGVGIGISGLVLSWLLPSHQPKSATTIKTTRRWHFLVHLSQTIHAQHAWRVIAILGAGFGLSNGLISTLSDGLSDGLYFGLINGLSNGLYFGLISILLSLILSAQAEGIALTDRLHWSWHQLMRSLLAPKHVRETFLAGSLVGLSVGLSYGLSAGLFDGLSDGLRVGLRVGLFDGLFDGLSVELSVGLLYWLLLGLFQGIESTRIEDHARRLPNQGVRRSLHNSVLLALISSALIWLISTLSNGLRVGLSNGLRVGLSSGLSNGLSAGLSNGLSAGWLIAVCGGLLVYTSRGGLAVLRHYVIRLLLAHAHSFPWRAPQFLEEATARILLRRVGGGYTFVHRLLLEYFAALDTAPPPGRNRGFP